MPHLAIGQNRALGSRIGVPSRLLISQPAGLPPTSLKSSPVNTASTPGIAAAFSVLMDLIRPCATVERTKTA